MNTDLIKRYAELKAKVKWDSDELAEVQRDIIDYMMDKNLSSVETPVGKFTLSFTQKIVEKTKPLKEKEAELKEFRTKLVQLGDLETTEVPTLRFYPNDL